MPKGRFRAPRRGGLRIGVEALLVEEKDAGTKGEEHEGEAGGDAEIVASSADLKEGPTCGRAFRFIEGKWGRLPCGGGGGLDFGFGEFRDDAELLHKAQSVPVDVAFRQLAVQEASDGHAGDGELLSGGGNPVEIPFVRTVTGPTGHDGIAFGNEVLDRQAQVGESSAVEGRSLRFTLGAVPKIG